MASIKSPIKSAMDQVPSYRVLEQTFLESISCWNTNIHVWTVKLNVCRQLQQKATEWAISVKIIKIGLNCYLEMEGKAVDLKFKLTKSFCRIDVLDNLDAIVSSHEGYADGPFYDKFNFEKLFDLADLYKKSPNLYHQVQGQPNTLALTLTIGPCKDNRRGFVKPQKRMLDERILTDTVIKTKTEDFPCHKFILATFSKYFSDKFLAKDNVVDWVDVFDSETVKDLLYFLYTGQTPPNINVTSKTLVEVAHLSSLEELKYICAETLAKIINVDNAGSILEIAEKFDLTSLRETAVYYVLDNYERVTSTRGFENIDGEIKNRLLKKVFQILGKRLKRSVKPNFYPVI